MTNSPIKALVATVLREATAADEKLELDMARWAVLVHTGKFHEDEEMRKHLVRILSQNMVATYTWDGEPILRVEHVEPPLDIEHVVYGLTRKFEYLGATHD